MLIYAFRFFCDFTSFVAYLTLAFLMGLVCLNFLLRLRVNLIEQRKAFAGEIIVVGMLGLFGMLGSIYSVEQFYRMTGLVILAVALFLFAMNLKTNLGEETGS